MNLFELVENNERIKSTVNVYDLFLIETLVKKKADSMSDDLILHFDRKLERINLDIKIFYLLENDYSSFEFGYTSSTYLRKNKYIPQELIDREISNLSLFYNPYIMDNKNIDISRIKDDVILNSEFSKQITKKEFGNIFLGKAALDQFTSFISLINRIPRKDILYKIYHLLDGKMNGYTVREFRKHLFKSRT
jgi:hypothetical protein